MADNQHVSGLIHDLAAVPSIIADLGLGIAEAQKAMNLAYLEGLERVTALMGALKIKPVAGQGSGSGGTTAPAASDDDTKILIEVLRALVPTRYQFTETTLSVKLDLSSSVRVSGGGSVGANLGAVVVNAALSVGYAYDSRGAAEVRTVIHAAPAGADVFDKLLARAGALGDKALTLPEGSKADKALTDASSRIFEKITGSEAGKITTASPMPAPPATASASGEAGKDTTAQPASAAKST